MTIEDIKEYIKNKVSNISTNEYITNYRGETTGQQISWWKGEEVINELNYILSMLDKLDEKPNAHWEHIPEKNTPWAVQYFRCSNCLGRISVHGTDNGFGYDYNVKEKHCPHCGAKMEPYKEKE